MSCLYALKYGHNLKKLQLLSPFGFAKKPEDYNIYEEVKKMRKGKEPSKFGFKLVNHAYTNQWSPFGVMRKCGRIPAAKFLNGFAKNRLKGMPKEEQVDYKKYLHQTLL